METIVIFLLSLIALTTRVSADECPEVPEPGYFYYFAYGSNLLPERMHINCPTATKCAPAQLPNYRLDFGLNCPRWGGAVATIVQDNNSTVWGNVWKIAMAEQYKLDKQEGVEQGFYDPKNVTVTFRGGENVTARVYIGNFSLAEKVEPEQTPKERQPSRTYHMTILLGAMRSELPVEYLNYIQRFPTNGKIAPSVIRKNLGYPFSDNSYL